MGNRSRQHIESARGMMKRERRQRFNEAYAANPLNFLPGRIVHKIQGTYHPNQWDFEGARILHELRARTG